jgi:hypothetical protein
MIRSKLFILMMLMPWATHAYIPEIKTILARTAENHGRGLYQVEQDITFATAPEPSVVKETWIIRDENSMRVHFEGRGPLRGMVQGTIVYENGHKHWLDEGGSVRQKRVSDDFFEPLFYFRYSKPFRARLIAQKLLPPILGHDRPSLVVGKAQGYTSPPGIRLSRVAGVVNYAMGTPTPPDGQLLPGLWIEQDQFQVRKARFASEATVMADQFQHFEQNLWLPKIRSVTWNNHSAQMQFLDVRSFGSKGGAEQAGLLSAGSLSGKGVPLKLSGDAEIGEFYTRFR